ncbi:MAG: ABC transporter substrate-binding protein [Gammaproteobacteria bacterium]|nr:ABC transporter substrate-binding protein [Gammaproteobacteria bacterium]MDP7419193.1 ABC transporter substrate-binding protein [Gammaproteobacteria bacterium]
MPMKFLLSAAILLTTALLLSGCGDSQDQGNPGSEVANLKVYRHAMDQAPTSLDPVQAANVYANFIVLNAFDTLFSYKYLARPYELKTNLAAAWPEISADGLTYTIRIKQGVHYVDDPAFSGGRGRELVAEDFIYSLKRHFDPASRPQGAWLWSGRIVGLDEWKQAGSDYSAEIAGLRTLDDYTIQIKLIKPYPQLLFTLAMGYSAVVPREAVEHYGREFAIHPVGTGPFRLTSYDTSKVILERNPNFRQEPVDIEFEGYDPQRHGFSGVAAIDGLSPPLVDRLEINFIAEASARWSSFTKGDEVQYASIPNEQVDQVLASKRPVTLKPEYAEKYHFAAGIEAGFVFQTFNMDFPEFGYNEDPQRERRNKALRCAINKAYAWEQRNESFYIGLGKVFPGIIVPVAPEFDTNLSTESITRDLAGAKKLLADHGWTPENLPPLVYGTNSSVTARLMFEQFRAWMKELGYPTEKIILKRFATFGDISKAWKESRLPFVSKGWGLDFPDAENTLQLFYGPNGSPGSNDANYRNPEYDRLYELASTMLSSPQRTEIYHRMNRLLIDDCVSITGLARTRIYLWHKDVIAIPDREIVGGFFLRYVDIADTEQPAITGSVFR